MIWTTTPWSLAANQAVCFNPDKEYCLVRIKDNHKEDEYWIIASELQTLLEQTWSKNLTVVNTFPGKIFISHHRTIVRKI